MATLTGRTHPKWVRVYASGYDISGYSRVIGPLKWEYDTPDLTALLGDAVRGYLPGQPSISCGTLNGVFDSTATSGLHAVTSTIASPEKIMIPIGVRAAPAAGVPVFMGEFSQLAYHAEEEDGAVFATVPFGEWDVANLLSHGRDKPWGVLVHAKAAATAANSAVGLDDYGSATALGGYMMYQIFDGDGTATITIEDASTNTDGNFALLTGATTGELDCSSVHSGIVDLTAAQAVKQYLRWQISLNTATTVTFALALMREI